MESLVTTFETSRKLKAAGLEIDAPVFGWQQFEGEWVIHSWDEIDEDLEWYIAFTAQEIVDQLPGESFELRLVWQVNLRLRVYMVSASDPGYEWEQGPTMAEALASVWLKLHEALPNNPSLAGDNGPLPTLSPELLKGGRDK